MKQIPLFFLIFFTKNVLSYQKISSVKQLPPVFKMDNYTQCKQEKNLFCEAQFELKPDERDIHVWKFLEKCVENDFVFRDKYLFRAQCYPKAHRRKIKKLKEFAIKRMENELKPYALKADLTDFFCKRKYSGGIFGKCFRVFLYGYLGCIALATIIDLCTKKSSKTKLMKYAQYFSIISNIQDMGRVIKNEHYVRLKAMQGLRFYSTIFVIIGHTLMSYSFSYLTNPEIFDWYLSNQAMIYAIFSLSYIVQVFFLISGWLLIIEIYTVSNKFQKFSLKQVMMLLVGRLLRYLPNLFFNYGLTVSNILLEQIDVPISKEVHRGLTQCKTNLHYFFIQNTLDIRESCTGHYWSFNIDLQMCLLICLVYYVMIKFKLNHLKCIWGLFVFFVLIHIYYAYIEDLDFVYKLTPTHIFPRHDQMIKNLRLNYTSTFSNSAGYLVGSIFGIFYIKNMHKKNVFRNIFWKLVWFVTSIGLICSSVVLIDMPVSKLTKSVMAGLLRPMYATGIALWLFGLSHNVSGILRKILEFRVAEILGSFTLSIYVFHFGYVFSRSFTTVTTFTTSTRIMITAMIVDVIISFIIGFIGFILVEKPFANIIREFMKKQIKQEDDKKSN